MLWKFRILQFLLIISLHFSNQAQTLVKVLLSEALPNESITWQFESKSDLRTNLNSPSNKKCSNGLKVELRNGILYVNGKHYPHTKLWIKAQKSPISVNGVFYDGNFLIYQGSNSTLLINQVEIEQYICSVLKTESWPGWPKEVNKVFAVASRSYVLAQVLRSRKAKLPYHIRNTNHHQTYSGIHDRADIKMAVSETKNLILTHNSEPILAMFDCCCGGVIPAHIDGVDFINHPYLARTKPCTHCKPFKIYSWQASYSPQDFKKIIQKALPHISTIKKITTRTDRAGTVKNLIVHSGKEVHTIDARTMYSLFKEIKSFCYSIYHHTNSIKLNGTGFGHHLGLCQWGAKKMVEKGYTYREILSFYYPHTKFVKLKE